MYKNIAFAMMSHSMEPKQYIEGDEHLSRLILGDDAWNALGKSSRASFLAEIARNFGNARYYLEEQSDPQFLVLVWHTNSGKKRRSRYKIAVPGDEQDVELWWSQQKSKINQSAKRWIERKNVIQKSLPDLNKIPKLPIGDDENDDDKDDNKT